MQDYVTKFPNKFIDFVAEWNKYCDKVLQCASEVTEKKTDYGKLAKFVYAQHKETKKTG